MTMVAVVMVVTLLVQLQILLMVFLTGALLSLLILNLNGTDATTGRPSPDALLLNGQFQEFL